MGQTAGKFRVYKWACTEVTGEVVPQFCDTASEL